MSTFVYRLVSTKKAANSNGNPKVQMTDKATTPTLNLFETLSTLVDGEEGWGNQTPSNNATLVVARINGLERQMVDGKLVLVDEHGKPLEMKSDEDEVEMPDDETSRYIASTSRGGFLKDDLDWFDGYKAQIYDLHEQILAFCNQFDIRLNSHVRK
ncbi:hypothetical protein Tco_0989779 [Tanacetum coccineum]|uniref:Uncharacterized protein n=1 Tax=Tanacetum coccineum TaxID=301880 RepID=A0ABQ5EUV2_9ASTR